MAQIIFKGKIQQVWNMDDTPAYRIIDVPKFDRKHCDMDAFRKHSKYGAYANSDMFPNILARIRKSLLGNQSSLRLDQLPENVQIDESGFLAKVIINI